MDNYINKNYYSQIKIKTYKIIMYLDSYVMIITILYQLKVIRIV